MRRILSLVAIGLLSVTATILISCGASRTSALSPATLWPIKVGEVRTYTNVRSVLDSNGNTLSTRTAGTTTFEVKPAIAMGCVTAYEIDISKDTQEAYWGPGYAQQDKFFVYTLPDGTITSPGEIHETWPSGPPVLTINFRNYSSTGPHTYSLLTPGITEGQSIRADYQNTTVLKQESFDCLPADPSQGVGVWKTDYHFDAVDTPGYKGPVLVARYAEGNDLKFQADSRCPVTASGWPLDPAVPCDENDAESWYFATEPPYGLVQITVHHLSFVDRFFDGRTDLPGHEETLVIKLASIK